MELVGIVAELHLVVDAPVGAAMRKPSRERAIGVDSESVVFASCVCLFPIDVFIAIANCERLTSSRSRGGCLQG